MKQDFTVHMTYNHTQIFKREKWHLKSYSGLERDNSKPRRGSFLNYFWKLAVYMQFVFVTAISISTSETQGKLTQYQRHRKKNNRKILHPVDLWAFGRFRSGKTTRKGNSMKSRRKKKN